MPARARDDSAEHRVRELARRVSAEVARGKMNCVNWNNREAVSEGRSQQMKSAFLEEATAKEAESAAGANCAVTVFVERTPTQIVLTAQVENAGGAQYLFTAIPRAGIPAENTSSAAPRLEKELVWQQSERILDALFVRGESGAGDRLIILQKEALNVYDKEGGAWKQTQAKPLGETGVAQRAPRGELYFSREQADRVKIVFTGKACQAMLNDASAPNCQQETQAARTGMLLASGCDSRVWWLRGDGGDSTMPDRLELVNSSQPQSQTPVAELTAPGPVLSISSGEALRADTAVVFNLATGTYEVYRIALACGL
jgi:hypothetical protein